MADTITANPTGGRQPPPPPLFPAYTPHPNLTTSPFLRGFAAGMVLLLLLALIIYLLEYLIFRPLLPEFRVDSLQLTNLSTAAASSVWVVGFAVRNPNKKLAVAFDNIESSIYYKTHILSQARIHRFAVRRRNSTAVAAPFVADSPADVSLSNAIKGDLARGAINVSVAVIGSVGFEAGVWRWRGSLCRVFCSDMAVGIVSGGGSGELVGGSRQCQVR